MVLIETIVDSKAKILTAAKELFARKGFEGTSTREIVNAAGVNISLIAYHFGGKENVLFALFDHFMDGAYHEDVSFGDSELVEEFKSILIRIIKLRFEEPELISILHHEIILNSGRTDKIKASLIPVWTRVELLLDEGKRRGLFSFENTKNALSFTMSVAIFPRMNQYFLELAPDQPEDIKNTVSEILGYILKGLELKY